MRSSLRLRLQAWYALVLLTVVITFAGILYYQVSAARWREIDGGLEAAATNLETQLQRFPPHGLSDHPPPPPSRPFEPGARRPPRGPPMGPPNREQLLRDLVLPEHLHPPGEGPPPVRCYFAVRRSDGTLLKAAGIPPEITTQEIAERP